MLITNELIKVSVLFKGYSDVNNIDQWEWMVSKAKLLSVVAMKPHVIIWNMVSLT